MSKFTLHKLHGRLDCLIAMFFRACTILVFLMAIETNTISPKMYVNWYWLNEMARSWHYSLDRKSETATHPYNFLVLTNDNIWKLIKAFCKETTNTIEPKLREWPLDGWVLLTVTSGWHVPMCRTEVPYWWVIVLYNGKPHRGL